MQGSLETKPSITPGADGQPLTLFRVGCSCPWAGMWYSTPVAAFAAHVAHVWRAERGL